MEQEGAEKSAKQLQFNIHKNSHIHTIYMFTHSPHTRRAGGLHARGGVHRVAKDAELGKLGADEATNKSENRESQ